MPYTTGKSAQCPSSKPWAVLGPDGKPVPGGCHPTQAKAQAHLGALQSNVPDAKSANLSDLKTRREPWRL